MKFPKNSPASFHSSSKKIAGLGIDLVSLKRTQRFLTQHSPSVCKELLGHFEHKFFRSGKISVRRWAKYFAAKEAYFKSLNQVWFGREGFSRVEIHPHSSHHFTASWMDRGERKWTAEGSWCWTRSHVIAHVIRRED